MRSLIIYVFILSMEMNKLLRLVSVSTFMVPVFGVSLLYSNTLMVCCGIIGNNEQKAVSPQVKFEMPVPSAPEIPKPGIKAVPAGKASFVNRFKKNKNTATNNKPIQGFRNLPQKDFKMPSAPVTVNGFRGMNTGKCGPATVTSSAPSSPALFYYAPRMKSIRVTSAPNIDGWEKSLREEMRLNGRAKHTVNRLLYRIQDYYEDPTIVASDYAPGNEGYQPSAEAREIAETRIRRSVESMAEFFKKSGNSDMNTANSPNGSSMMKGKLTFINTQLDKLGKPRVGIEELREIVGMKINPPAPLPQAVERIAIPEGMVPDQPVPQIANQVEQAGEALQNLDLAALGINKEDVINGNVDEIYLTFARWLADNGKTFPSLDPEVDDRTLRYFELVNRELRELGKFENLQIFRQKTLAHLDEVLDDRGLTLEPGEMENQVDQASEAMDDDPLFRGQKKNATPYVHLASLPGNVVSTGTKGDFEVSRPQRRERFDDTGNKVSVRVMNNLPGRIIH